MLQVLRQAVYGFKFALLPAWSKGLITLRQITDKGWGFLSINKPAVMVGRSAMMTAGKTALTDNQTGKQALNLARFHHGASLVIRESSDIGARYS